MARRRLQTFNDDFARRARFEREARERGLAFQCGYRGRPRRLVYRVPITIPVYDEDRVLTITMPASAKPGVVPLVKIDGPVCMRHRYPVSGGLCMWWPEDDTDHAWIPEDGLLALVGHATTHAYCEAQCQRGEPWPRPEAPTQHRTTCPTCQSLR